MSSQHRRLCAAERELHHPHWSGPSPVPATGASHARDHDLAHRPDRRHRAGALPIPGATPDGIKATLVNVDGAKGLVTTIIHIAPNARIPAHFHNDGAEAHFVIEGDFINAGIVYGPGSFIPILSGSCMGRMRAGAAARF